VYDDKIDLKKLKKNEMLELLEKIFSNSTPTTVLYEDKPLVNDVHPTMKPIRLMAQLIKNSTKPKQIVLDVFGGSGSTLIACEQLDRSCYMMELDPKYVDVIIDRWEKFTGQKAVKLN
jgi:DNA modification methylase